MSARRQQYSPVRHGWFQQESPQMKRVEPKMVHEIAQIASALQKQRTGHAPSAVTVVLSEDTLVVTLHEALTPAEKALAKDPAGAAKVQEFHRQLFSNSCGSMRQEIKRITGRQVREAAAEIETASGTVVHAFTTGAMVQVFLLTPDGHPVAATERESIERLERADGDGLRITVPARDSK
jgi:uncharacterized protein YbcI